MYNFLQRDFLLGVGVGFIISAIMVSVFGRVELTDQDIKAGAAKLGMVQKEQSLEDKRPTDAEDVTTAAEKVYKQSYQISSGQPAASADTTETPGTVKPVSVQVVIRPGMGSEQIAKMLEEKGVVKDQREFYQVVTEMKAHTRFRTGTFTVPSGGDMREIVRILTNNP